MVHDRLGDYSGVSKSDFPWFFNSLYSAYSLPNLILPLISGYVFDRTSGILATVALAVIACIGQALLLIGITESLTWASISGRVIFGIGAESMGVAQNAILTHFFNYKEIAFALALNVSVARIGTIANDWITPHVEARLGIPAAFSLGLGMTIISVLCTLEMIRVMWSVPASSTETTSTVVIMPTTSESFMSSTKSLTPQYWISATICVAGYCAIIPFTSVFMAFRPPDLSQASAGQVVSIAYVICAVVTPLFGKLVDRYERANLVLVSCSFLLCLTHAMYMSFHHGLVMILLGLGYAGLVAAIWPLVPFTVAEQHVGLAYGIMTALQNFGLTLMPLMVCRLPSSLQPCVLS